MKNTISIRYMYVGPAFGSREMGAFELFYNISLRFGSNNIKSNPGLVFIIMFWNNKNDK